MITVEQIEFKLSNGETVQANFSEYGWQQWGARQEMLRLTMPLVQTLLDAAAVEPELSELLGICEPHEEEEEDEVDDDETD